MKYLVILSLLFTTLVSCQPKNQTEFTEKALSQKVLSASLQDADLKSILEQHKGKKLIIDVWASWCGDCIKGLPKINKFQEKHPEVEFVFISVDRTQEEWQAGVDKFFPRFKVEGEHYYMGSSKDSVFREFLKLDWIPRYLLVDEKGEILVYYAKSIEDEQLNKVL